MKRLSLLLFATTVVAAVSCTKSDSPTNPDPTPSTDTGKTVEIAIPVATDNHNAFFEMQYEFDLNGTKVTFKQSDMTELTTESELKQISDLINKTEGALKGSDYTARYYKYTLGKLKTEEKLSGVSLNYTIKSDRPSVEDFDFLFGYKIYINGQSYVNGNYPSIMTISFRGGVVNTDAAITVVLNSLNKDFKTLTFSY